MNVNEAKIFLANLDQIPTTCNDVAEEVIKKLNTAMNVLQSDLSVWRDLDNLPHEIWRDIVGYEEIYQVSIFGRIMSFYGKTPRILKATNNGNGYLQVTLSLKGKHKQMYPHILLATAFIPNPENKPTVNHIYGDKSNNCIWALEWATRSENTLHGVKTGLIKVGCAHPNSKLHENDVRYIRNNPDKLRTMELAEKFNVSLTAVRQIRRGDKYKNIT